MYNVYINKEKKSYIWLQKNSYIIGQPTVLLLLLYSKSRPIHYDRSIKKPSYKDSANFLEICLSLYRNTFDFKIDIILLWIAMHHKIRLTPSILPFPIARKMIIIATFPKSRRQKGCFFGVSDGVVVCVSPQSTSRGGLRTPADTSDDGSFSWTLSL